jgi:hypothetical protein
MLALSVSAHDCLVTVQPGQAQTKQDYCVHYACDLCEQHAGSRDTVSVVACEQWTAEIGAILRNLRSVFTQLPDRRALPRARR